MLAGENLLHVSALMHRFPSVQINGLMNLPLAERKDACPRLIFNSEPAKVDLFRPRHYPMTELLYSSFTDRLPVFPRKSATLLIVKTQLHYSPSTDKSYPPSVEFLEPHEHVLSILKPRNLRAPVQSHVSSSAALNASSRSTSTKAKMPLPALHHKCDTSS